MNNVPVWESEDKQRRIYVSFGNRDISGNIVIYIKLKNKYPLVNSPLCFSKQYTEEEDVYGVDFGTIKNIGNTNINFADLEVALFNIKHEEIQKGKLNAFGEINFELNTPKLEEELFFGVLTHIIGFEYPEWVKVPSQNENIYYINKDL